LQKQLKKSQPNGKPTTKTLLEDANKAVAAMIKAARADKGLDQKISSEESCVENESFDMSEAAEQEVAAASEDTDEEVASADDDSIDDASDDEGQDMSDDDAGDDDNGGADGDNSDWALFVR
jgi:hypothetical protein